MEAMTSLEVGVDLRQGEYIMIVYSQTPKGCGCSMARQSDWLRIRRLSN